jgi:hypothetical protein
MPSESVPPAIPPVPPRRTSRLRRGVRRALFALGAAALLAVLACATLAVFWRYGGLKHWVQAKLIEVYLAKIQPHLPFTIEKVETDTGFRALMKGHVSRLSLVLRHEGVRVRLSGPIDVERPNQTDHPNYSIRFATQVTVEPVGALGAESAASLRSTPFNLTASLHATPELSQLLDAELLIQAPRFKSEWLKLDLTTPRADITWKEKNAKLSLRLGDLNWTLNPEHTFQAKGLSFTASSALTLKPFVAGPEVAFEWKGVSAETLWGTLYLDLPLARLPIQGTINLDSQSVSLKLEQLKLTASRKESGEVDVAWHLADLPLRELIEELKKASGGGMGPFAAIHALDPLDLRAGLVSSEGRAVLNPDTSGPGALPLAEGTLRLRDAALRYPAGDQAELAARGIQVELPFSTRKGVTGILSASELYFRHLKARLGPTRLSAEPLGRDVMSADGLRVRLSGTANRGGSDIPLTIEGIPLEIGPVAGTFKPSAPEGTPPFALRTSARLNEVGIESILRPLCAGGSRLPPVVLRADLPSIDLAPGEIDPDGEIALKAFGGTARVSDFGIFDMGSAMPEIDFDLDFAGVRLDQLGEWSNFGDMKGTLKGFAHDVVIRGWLPTHFDASIDAVPISRWIEFSPEAMRNLVNLFAGEAIDELPGISKETFFGWVSRRLGGYDVAYAGLSLYSQDGTTLVETHDPPDILWAFKKHYIFWGRRFKMPLNSPHYPVVVDQTGVGIYTRGMMAYLQTLAKQKETANHASQPSAQETCLPPAF